MAPFLTQLARSIATDSDDLFLRLQRVLGEGYRLDRELGGGGMSRVFEGEDLALRRRVVIKVLPPDLAAVTGGERFRREIQLAAQLQHPYIVPLLSAGAADGLLYYTMPLIKGESLRTKLQRSGELPLPDVVRILRDLADALAHAHGLGVVHRDIKPDNVLLSGQHSLVTDFGIAKALSASADASSITSVGLALGTVAYMAPEQATADPSVDHRADLYSLGVLGYEMLTGQPPFAGRTAEQLLAAHVNEPPVPVATRRPATPTVVGELIMRLLEKHRADRPQTAAEVLRTLDKVPDLPEAGTSGQTATTPAAAVPAAAPPVATAPAATARRHRWLAISGIAALILVVAVAWLARREPPAAVDPSVVAVAPFRVTAADSSLAYLREGMVDLLAAKLSGTAQVRPADPRTLLSAWKRVAQNGSDLPHARAVGLAAQIGAGRLVEGEVVGSGHHLSISATLLRVPRGEVGARVAVEGEADSLTQLVDRLAASLLALGAGEGEQRLTGLTSTSLPALRLYLDGQALLRRGAFDRAMDKFSDAFRLDSTFALAAIGVARAGEWTGAPFPPALEAAWRHRERLSLRDRAQLETYLPRFPEGFGKREYIDAGERFVRLAPDSPDAWYALGDALFHVGRLVGVPDALQRAAAAFDRSLALDSSYAPAIQHLSEIRAGLGDTARIRQGLAVMLRGDSTSGRAEGHRWFVASLLGDSVEARRALASDSIALFATLWVALTGLEVAVDLTGTESLFPRARAPMATAEERTAIETEWHRYALIRGRPDAGPRVSIGDAGSKWGRAARVLEGLFADGDSVDAAVAASQLERDVVSPVVWRDSAAVLARYAVGQYGLAHQRLALARRMAADLRRATFPADSWWREPPRRFALILDAQLAARAKAPNATDVLRELDSALINPFDFEFATYGNLVSARLHEERGNLSSAVALVRHRELGGSSFPAYVRYLREEGRLAALTGDRDGAIKAYKHYLLLRQDPEARLRPQRDSVRVELDALLRESPDKP
jgi:serine/threonine-protein kinase